MLNFMKRQCISVEFYSFFFLTSGQKASYHREFILDEILALALKYCKKVNIAQTCANDKGMWVTIKVEGSKENFNNLKSCKKFSELAFLSNGKHELAEGLITENDPDFNNDKNFKY